MLPHLSEPTSFTERLVHPPVGMRRTKGTTCTRKQRGKGTPTNPFQRRATVRTKTEERTHPEL